MLATLRRLKLPLREPFAGWNAGRIADRFRYTTMKLAAAGTMAAAYSVHDLRHLFATRLYLETRDIYLVSKALKHASVAVTQVYLRKLALMD